MPADDTEKEVRASKNPNGPFNHQRFFSLAELNAAIRDLVVQINGPYDAAPWTEPTRAVH